MGEVILGVAFVALWLLAALDWLAGLVGVVL